MWALLTLTLGVGVRQDLVFAVAIRAQGRLRDAARPAPGRGRCRGTASTTSVWHMPQVSGTAVRKAWDFGAQQFVGAAVAQGAIGRAFVAALARLAVDTLFVVAGLVGVARDAGRLGDIGRMGDFVVGLVAGIAGERGMRALGEFRPLIVTGGAFGRRFVGGGVARQGGTRE